MAPVIKALHKRKIPLIFTYCGQRYDYSMPQQFIEQEMLMMLQSSAISWKRADNIEVGKEELAF
jgi:hypothetical protein